jgi:hypothetical protein
MLRLNDLSQLVSRSRPQILMSDPRRLTRATTLDRIPHTPPVLLPPWKQHFEEIHMFGAIQEPVKPEPAPNAVVKPTSALASQAQAFFAGLGAKVTVASAPRPVRPGSRAPARAASSALTAATYRSSFASPADDAAAGAREQEMAAEADIIDDSFGEFDAPGC